MSSKRVKRVRRKKGGSKTLHFNKDTHEAIVRYQSKDDLDEKEKIYVNDILPAFDKLCENLIFIHGFAKNADSYESLKSDCVAFLYETLEKFDPSRGTKAFSYFNVVAKNWLIINSRRTQKSTRRHVSIDDPESMSVRDRSILAQSHVLLPPDEIMIKETFRDDIMKVLFEIQTRVTGENEKKCIAAVVKVFETVDQLDFLNTSPF